MRRLAPDINHMAAAVGVLYPERKERGEGGMMLCFLASWRIPRSLSLYISVSLNFFFTDVLRFWILGYQKAASCACLAHSFRSTLLFSYSLACWGWAKTWVTFCPCCMYIYQALLCQKTLLWAGDNEKVFSFYSLIRNWKM
jgi:hypothetical protein